MLAAVLTAIFRGRGAIGHEPAMLLAHLSTILVALALTPVVLLSRKGTARHRVLGYVWCGAMALTAAASLFVRISRPGHFSLIHLLSVYVLVQLPLIVVRARQHDAERHRRNVHGMVIGSLLIAGFFTFPFNRLLGQWLFAPLA